MHLLNSKEPLPEKLRCDVIYVVNVLHQRWRESRIEPRRGLNPRLSWDLVHQKGKWWLRIWDPTVAFPAYRFVDALELVTYAGVREGELQGVKSGLQDADA
jgi:hypothetical protein